MTGDFNICNSLWDLLFPHYSSISDNLLIIADSFNLELSSPINQAFTRYSDNDHNSNSVIDLIFLCNSSSELDNHLIHSDWHLMSDYASLTITISISEEYINSRKRSIIKDSEKEMSFIKDLISSIRNLHTSNLLDEDGLERVVIEFAKVVKCAWEKNSKFVNITKYSKSWWNTSCNRDLERYRLTRSLEDWKSFQKQLRLRNVHSLISKSRKLLTKNEVSGNSWIGSISTGYQLLRLLSITVNYASN